MKYYFIDTLGRGDPKNYFVDGRPSEVGLGSWRMARGAKAADLWPADPAILRPSDRTAAIKLPPVIPTTLSYLIASSAVRKQIEAHCPGAEIEYLPVVLMSKKKREQSRDYCMINPLGTIDCLDLQRSVIAYSPTIPGAVLSVDTFVIDPRKVEGAPALFRIKEAPEAYVISEPLAQALRAPEFAQVRLTDIEVTPR